MSIKEENKEDNKSVTLDMDIVSESRFTLTDYQLKKARYFFHVNLDIENKKYITWEDVEFYILFHLTATGRESDSVLEKSLQEKCRIIWEKIKSAQISDTNMDHLTVEQFLDTWASLRDYINKYDSVPNWLKEWIEIGFQLYDTEETGTLKPSIFYALYSKMGLDRISPAVAFRALTEINKNPLNVESIFALTKRLIVSDDVADNSRFLLPGFAPTEALNKKEPESKQTSKEEESSATMKDSHVSEKSNEPALHSSANSAKQTVSSATKQYDIKIENASDSSGDIHKLTKQQQYYNNKNFSDRIHKPTTLMNEHGDKVKQGSFSWEQSTNPSFKNENKPNFTPNKSNESDSVFTGASFLTTDQFPSGYPNFRAQSDFVKSNDQTVICEILSEMNINPSECEILIDSENYHGRPPLSIDRSKTGTFTDCFPDHNHHWKKLDPCTSSVTRPFSNNQPINAKLNVNQPMNINRISPNESHRARFNYYQNQRDFDYDRFATRPKNFRNTMTNPYNRFMNSSKSTGPIRNRFLPPFQRAQPSFRFAQIPFQQTYSENVMTYNRCGVQPQPHFNVNSHIPINRISKENRQQPLLQAHNQHIYQNTDVIVSHVIHKIKPIIREIVREELNKQSKDTNINQQTHVPRGRNIWNKENYVPSFSNRNTNAFTFGHPAFDDREGPNRSGGGVYKSRETTDKSQYNSHHRDRFKNNDTKNKPATENEDSLLDNNNTNKMKTDFDNDDDDDEFWRGESGQLPSINRMIFNRLLKRQYNEKQKNTNDGDDAEHTGTDSKLKNKESNVAEDVNEPSHKSHSTSTGQLSESSEVNDEMIFIPGMGGFGTFVPLNIDSGYMHNPGFNHIPFDSYMMSVDNSEDIHNDSDEATFSSNREHYNNREDIQIVIDDSYHHADDSHSSSVLDGAN